MGKEIEYKLGLSGPEALEELLRDETLQALAGPWQERQMRTTYYDTPEGTLGRKHWTLRQRQEGDCPVVCLKTPAAGGRNEYEVPGEQVDGPALRALLTRGAPAEILEAEGKVFPICGAAFTRRSAVLTFRDGSRAEAAGDLGILRGKTQALPFAELELELLEGGLEEMTALRDLLCSRYGIAQEKRSKFARARALD